jgi:hypothetical protein
MIGHFPFYLVLDAITPKRYNITVYFVVLEVHDQAARLCKYGDVKGDPV